jgi:hypothetical protein
MVIRGQLIDEGTWEDPAATKENRDSGIPPRPRMPSPEELRNLGEER